MKNQIRILFTAIGVAASVLVATGFYVANAGNLDAMEYILIALVLLLVGGSAIILLGKSRNVQKKLPLHDELAKKVAWKSGYYAYLSSVWIAVGLLWYNTYFFDNFGFPKLDFEEVIGVIVLLPGTVFIGLSLYFNKLGDLE